MTHLPEILAASPKAIVVPKHDERLVKLITMPRFDPAERVEMTLAYGSTLATLVDKQLPTLTPEHRLSMLRVTIGGHVIEPQFWRVVRPKAGTLVVIRVVPGKSNILRSVLLITASLAAVALGQFYLPGVLGAGGLGLTGGALTAATGFGSSLMAPGDALAIDFPILRRR